MRPMAFAAAARGARGLGLPRRLAAEAAFLILQRAPHRLLDRETVLLRVLGEIAHPHRDRDLERALGRRERLFDLGAVVGVAEDAARVGGLEELPVEVVRGDLLPVGVRGEAKVGAERLARLAEDVLHEIDPRVGIVAARATSLGRALELPAEPPAQGFSVQPPSAEELGPVLA